jgi:hypothetical protein
MGCIRNKRNDPAKTVATNKLRVDPRRSAGSTADAIVFPSPRSDPNGAIVVKEALKRFVPRRDGITLPPPVRAGILCRCASES